MLAKWLCRDFEVFLLDEPTRGIDQVARRKVYSLLDQLAQRNKATLIVSSDLEELTETCDRILVMSQGKIVAEFFGPKYDAGQVTQASFASEPISV